MQLNNQNIPWLRDTMRNGLFSSPASIIIMWTLQCNGARRRHTIRSNYSRWVEYQHLRTNANVPVRSMRRIYMRGSVRETASRVMV